MSKKGFIKLSAVWIMAITMLFCFHTVSAKGAEQIPKITFVGVDHSPLVEGDMETFSVTSDYAGKVQYRAFLYTEKTNKWEEITSGYAEPVYGNEVYTISPAKKFALGKYKLSIHVKRIESDNKYDSYYVAYLNCVNKDDRYRVYANGAMEVDKERYVLGETVEIKGIKGISGMKAPYKYKLHIYDVDNNQWIKDVTGWMDTIAWKPEKPGTYVLDLWATSSDSKAKYEAWKLKTITVQEDTPVAIVNGQDLMKSELILAMKPYYEQLEALLGEEFAGNTEVISEIKAVEQNILNNLVTSVIFKQNIENLDEVALAQEIETQVERAYNEMKASYEGEGTFEENLEKNALTKDLVKRQIKTYILTEVLYSILEGQVSDATLQAFYEAHPYLYTEVPNTMEVSHILVRTKEEAEELKKRLDAGEDFAALAKEKGLDGTKDNGGELGKIQYYDENYDADFMAAAMEVKEGQVSDPVKTTFGYHLIKVTKREEHPVKPMEEVKEKIVADYISSLLKTAKVEWKY